MPFSRIISLKTSKFTIITLSILTLLATFYVYDESLYEISHSIFYQTRLLGKKQKVKARKPKSKNLVWLMAYPYGGAEATMNIVEHATNKSMATNYGDEVQTYDLKMNFGRFESKSIQEEWFPDGPFRNNADLPFDSDTMLVRTHCGGVCLFEPNFDCNQEVYINQLVNGKKFWTACKSGRSYKPGYRVQDHKTTPYSQSRVKKIVITKRNPMVMVVSRFRDYATKSDEYKFRVNENGLHDWCAKVDNTHKNTGPMKHLLAKKWIKEKLEGVPCYTEFVRIMLWYDMVIKGTQRRNKIIIGWEEYVKNLDYTAGRLLEFIGLRKTTDKNWMFDTHGPLYEWFTHEEEKKIGELMKAVGRNKSPAWSLFQKYFP